MTEPHKIPTTVRQALKLLGKMKISYRYIQESDLWEFMYDGLYLLLMNDSEDTELVIYAPVITTFSDYGEIQKIVFDSSLPVLEHDFPIGCDCDFGFDGDGLCHIVRSWKFETTKQSLSSKSLNQKLMEMHNLQIKFYYILLITYETMFNPPVGVMREILSDTKDTLINE